jgi:D-glycerate 3-kinase
LAWPEADAAALAALLAERHLPDSFRTTFERICLPLARRAEALRRARGRTVVLGLCGAQGSGKSTIAAATVRLLQGRRLSAVTLSLDDVYLTAAARRGLAARVHPLLATRGPPGTHDVALATQVLEALSAPGEVAIPSFDKIADERRAPSEWPRVRAPVDVVIFEGWCLGARPQAAADLVPPRNALEAEADADGRWRRYVNDQLAGPYQELFARLDELVLLQAPSFDVVLGWRIEQERRLAGDGGMSEAEVARFVQHYERLTRWILQEMPARADLTIPLAPDRTPL